MALARGPGLAVMLLAVVSTVAVGCAGTTVVARKNPEFSEKLSKLGVIAHLERPLGADLARAFSDQMTAALRARNVEAHVISVEELAVDTAAYRAQMDRFSPRHVMVIRATKGTRGPYGEVLSVSFDVVVSPFSPTHRIGDKLLWRATVEYRPGYADVSAGARALGPVQQ